MKSDLEIAHSIALDDIRTIAAGVGIEDDELELYGNYKAKVKLSLLDRLKDRPLGKYIDVTAITPTPLGEGKTVTTIGLSLALNHIGKKTITCIRQPSLGPVFGIKGGAAGGGYSQVLPMEDFNLHLTGDIHAVSLANNLAAACIDASIHHGNPLSIDASSPMLRRVVDISDRWALDDIIIGLQGNNVRRTGFDIAVASEVMAILGLSTDLQDMRRRIGRMVVARTKFDEPITCEQLRCAGAMTVLMRDAIKPTLMQTTEHTPVFVHAGPFANIAHGNSSIIADRMALRLGEFCVTESGFGADIGMEKFFNIKCRMSGLKPAVVVLVATVRALKMHSGQFTVVAGKPLNDGLLEENVAAVEAGCANLDKQIENALKHGVPVVVAINRFENDTEKEIQAVRERAVAAGAETAEVSQVHALGGKGGVELAEAVVEAASKPSHFKLLYEDEWPIKQKIETIAREMYGADGVSYAAVAEDKIRHFTEHKYDRLPICMAKTHLSLSHDPKLKGRPQGFVLPVRDILASVGAGFLYPLAGEMRTMPGLPSQPAAWKIDIDEQGNVVGLF
ncbi:MAG: formate--tetrahydrofolate ligase [Planctomycetes bacterium]|nr:formate--tetrahydrofolate ligase [Planctomycetota bacterium]